MQCIPRVPPRPFSGSASRCEAQCSASSPSPVQALRPLSFSAWVAWFHLGHLLSLLCPIPLSLQAL